MTAAADKNLARLNEEAFERYGELSVAVLRRAVAPLGGAIRALEAPGRRFARAWDRARRTVVVCMANCPEVSVSYHALWRAGAVVTPAMFLLSTEDLHHVIAHSEASAVITAPEFLDKVREAVAPLHHVRHVISTGPGEPGEVCVRSPAVMQGYWRAPEATMDTIREGWLHTGDIGYLDDEGYLFIVDRKKDLIIRDGFNVYPRDVEDALLEHPLVAGAGVVGRPDARRGEQVVAFVSLTSPGAVREEELIDWARQRIGGYKYPREVHIVDAIPLTAVGKLDRKALRAGLL